MGITQKRAILWGFGVASAWAMPCAQAWAENEGGASKPAEERTAALLSAFRQCCPATKAPASAAESDCPSVHPFFAYDELAQDVLLPLRKSLTPRQHERLKSALQTILQKTAQRSGRAFCAAQPTVHPGKAHPRGIEVECSLIEPDQEIPSTFSFVWRRHKDAWRIADLLVEGGSLVADYQGQLARIQKKEGTTGLMRRMQERAASLQQSASAPPSPSAQVPG